jgi:spermidine/putrescine transport system ATP-binding protein
MSDRIAVMNAGRVEQLGTPREVYESPETRFVADFIGTSNVINAAATRLDADEAEVDGGQDGRIVVPLRGRRPEGELCITVRPEKIALSHDAPDTDCRVRGTVNEVVYQGTFTGYTVTTARGHHMVVHRQNSDDSRDIAAAGDSVWLSWAREHSYLIHEKPEAS